MELHGTQSLMHTYKRLPVAFTRGEGAYLWDTQGRRYLDALGGIAVCGLGHAHPAIAATLAQQGQCLWHTSNLYHVPQQEKLGATLCELSGMQRVFFGNSGAEANEAAIKIARRYAHSRGISNGIIVVMEGAFHGRTMAALSATGNHQAHAGFTPLLSGFTRVPFGDLLALQRLATETPDIVAVLIEPIQGEGGIQMPPEGYLQAVRELCDQQQWLMMLDEIQTGMGRTGHWFAFQQAGITPDVMSLAKSLGNGFPISATLATGTAAELLVPGSHGSTFGGNPLGCAVASSVVQTIQQQDLLSHAANLGASMLADFRTRFAGFNSVKAVRGRGLMLGIELAHECGALVQQALDAGILINVTAGKVIRLLPPLIIDRDQARLIVDQVSDLVEAHLAV